ncbi:MAG: hypothetical protein ACD_11C00133G0011 [uncultured bacterium]|nr:MAG: hypothetical protein ACD_11C00133G0011 [uncultured bacterium]
MLVNLKKKSEKESGGMRKGAMIGLLVVFWSVSILSSCWSNVELNLDSLSYTQESSEKARITDEKFPKKKMAKIAVFQIVDTGKIFVVYDFSHISLGADGCILMEYEGQEIVAEFIGFYEYEVKEDKPASITNVGR